MEKTESLTPWGKWVVLLETSSYKVKEISVNPNHRLSYQTHKHRQEVWTIVQGNAEVTIDGQIKQFKKNDVIEIGLQVPHRIANYGKEPLVFIEVQTGTYFGEADIIRIEDDYNRPPKETN